MAKPDVPTKPKTPRQYKVRLHPSRDLTTGKASSGPEVYVITADTLTYAGPDAESDSFAGMLSLDLGETSVFLVALDRVIDAVAIDSIVSHDTTPTTPNRPVGTLTALKRECHE
jgi:hypothetical protein